mgnify:CR=1 FL=1
MIDEVKRILGKMIRLLDEQPHKAEGGWIDGVKQINTKDDDDFQEGYIALSVIQASMEGCVNGILSALGGTNRLTPSLTTRGWKFWKAPLITGIDQQNIEAMVVDWPKAQKEKIVEMTTYIEQLASQVDDSNLMALYSAAVLCEVQDVNIRYFHDNLQQIVSNL